VCRPPSANQLKAARLLTARTLDEFLHDAVRTPSSSRRRRPALDDDSIDVLNEQMPLALLRDIGDAQACRPGRVSMPFEQCSHGPCCFRMRMPVRSPSTR
jgi:hypothetical protein